MEYASTNSGNLERFCSVLSLENDESMIGTASRVNVWFLLEYTGAWLAKATDNNDLPQKIQDWLKAQLSLVDKGRVQFIKQDRVKNKSTITFFLALTRKENPRLYQFELDDYQDLLQLDIPALISGATTFDDYIRVDPLYLVCTNGKRDRCCALHGLILYQAMTERAADAVWQSTHLGGHRFAPTLVTFPDGAFYGRLAASHVNSFVKAQEDGKFYLSHLRGRSSYGELTQAAEQFLHQKTGLFVISGYRHLLTKHLEGANWSVDFKEPISGDIHRLVIRQELSTSERLVSCSPPKSKLVKQFHLVSHERING